MSLLQYLEDSHVEHIKNLEEDHIAARAGYDKYTTPERQDETAQVCRWLSENHKDARHIFVTKSDAQSLTGSLPDAVGLFQTIHHALEDDGEMVFLDIEYFGPRILFACPQDPYVPTLIKQEFKREVDHQKLPNTAGTIKGRYNTFDEFVLAYTAKRENDKAREEDFQRRLQEFQEDITSIVATMTPTD